MDMQASQSGADAELTLPLAAEARHQRISTPACYRAECRAFQGGDPVADWLEAEAEIDRTLEPSSSPGQPPEGETKRRVRKRPDRS
jgi:hypothetical protein